MPKRIRQHQMHTFLTPEMRDGRRVRHASVFFGQKPKSGICGTRLLSGRAKSNAMTYVIKAWKFSTQGVIWGKGVYKSRDCWKTHMLAGFLRRSMCDVTEAFLRQPG